MDVKDKISIIQDDITTLEVEAVVNAANKSLLGGGGVDGAIHQAAGPELLEATKKLNGAETGEAKITEGYNLPANYVIHTVGPVYTDGTSGESELLAMCYKNSLKLAAENNIQTIAFPSISTGAYGYPLREATTIAVKTIIEMLEKPEMTLIEKVVFVVFSKEDFSVYQDTLADI